MRIAAGIAACLLALLLTFATRTANHESVFLPGAEGQPGQIFFVDADCYSRMTRVAMVMAQPGLVLKSHAWENAPVGTQPHTTVVMDYLIALPGWIIGADLAGAWIAPVLALLGVGFLCGWAWREEGVSAGGAFWLVTVMVLSFMVAQGNMLGRPDHQALLLVLLPVALAAELSQLRAPSRAWAITAGAAWGMALWTSLFEPAVFILVNAVLVALLGRKTWKWSTRGWELGVLGGILLLALVIEGGVRMNVPGQGAEGEFFAKWARDIAEMRPMGSALIQALPGWVGWAVFAAPVLIGLTWWKTRDPRALYIGVLFLVLVVLAWGPLRWAPYLCIVYALTLPWQLPWLEGKPRWILHGALVALFLFPMASLWDQRTDPSTRDEELLAEMMLEGQLTRQIAGTIASLHQQPSPAASPEWQAETMVAPWWITPSLVYWSDAPGVAGSSHQALPGTVASAQIYMATDPMAAARLLRERRVRWLVAYEPSRVKQTSARLLYNAMPQGQHFIDRLYSHPDEVPNYLQLTSRNQFFVLYEVQPEVLDKWLAPTAGP